MKNIVNFLIMLTLAATAFGQQKSEENLTGIREANPGRPIPLQNTVPGQRDGNGKDAAAKDAVARPVSVQVLVGSQGIGADVKYGILPKLSGRAGFGIIPVTVNGVFTVHPI